MKSPRAWYRISAQAEDPTTVDIYVYDAIGKWYAWDDDAVTAIQFAKDVKALADTVKTIRVHINSPGGDCAEALAIANILRAQRDEKGRTVEVLIEGLAASAATIISSAGAPIKMADNALMMIHDPWSIEIGSAATMRKAAETLDKFRDAIVATYRWVSKKTSEELAALMAAETWMSAAEALEHGLITNVVESAQVSDLHWKPAAMNRLTNVPDQHKAAVEAFIAKPAAAPAPAAAVDVLRLCREGGVSDIAEGLIGANATLDQVNTAIASKKTERSAAATRDREIRALCKTANREDLAESYLTGGMTVGGVRAQLTTITALLDQAAINTGLSPDHGNKTKARIDTQAVYAQLNGESKAKE